MNFVLLNVIKLRDKKVSVISHDYTWFNYIQTHCNFTVINVAEKNDKQPWDIAKVTFPNSTTLVARPAYAGFREEGPRRFAVMESICRACDRRIPPIRRCDYFLVGLPEGFLVAAPASREIWGHTASRGVVAKWFWRLLHGMNLNLLLKIAHSLLVNLIN